MFARAQNSVVLLILLLDYDDLFCTCVSMLSLDDIRLLTSTTAWQSPLFLLCMYPSLFARTRKSMTPMTHV